MEPAEIRIARETDAEGLVHAHEAAWDAALAPIVGSRLDELAPLAQRVEGARGSLADPPENARAWVAERGGGIVGMATAHDDELRSLYVAPVAWGTGVAQELMGAALEWMAGRGVREAFLWVGEENRRARRFYEREGWTADGETRTSSVGPLESRYRLSL